MRLLTILTWGILGLGVRAGSGDASIYIKDNVITLERPKVPSISPNIARLLFAQRLGLSQYHELGNVDETTLEVLNQYGGQQPSLLVDAEESRQQTTDRLLFIIEGVEFPEGKTRPSLII